ncbi:MULTISPECIES: hypothetical protein [Rhizobium]|uniref:Porin n=1 Tax=Rhizobium wenxiniae TaxID=1737357 RepID=A0A7W9Y7F8_9HYPH|nr:hypothetical protein [Rhizobium wenxiniae]MBB6163380.1 hypothetical protein [Rhizobium wenxiniae]GGG09174.1 hypothetical protein GCM10010924_42620 [Rhizobium wenxiniae]
MDCWRRGPYDSFGAGIYYNAISPDLKNSIKTLTGGVGDVKDEKGMEVFYDFAFIPAMRLIIPLPPASPKTRRRRTSSPRE